MRSSAAAYALSGHGEEAGDRLERALVLAERLQLPEVFVEALTSKAIVLTFSDRLAEARILLEAAAARRPRGAALRERVCAQSTTSASVLEASDRFVEAVETVDRVARTRAPSRRPPLGVRPRGPASSSSCYYLGRWDEALAVAAEEEAARLTQIARQQMIASPSSTASAGELERAQALRRRRRVARRATTRRPEPALAAVERARAARRGTATPRRWRRASRASAILGELPLSDRSVKSALVEAIEAALALGDLDKAEELLAIPAALDPGQLTPFLQANAARLGARLDAARGWRSGSRSGSAPPPRSSASSASSSTSPSRSSSTASGSSPQGRADEAQPLLAEARETFERLQATPWLERSADFVLLQH